MPGLSYVTSLSFAESCAGRRKDLYSYPRPVCPGVYKHQLTRSCLREPRSISKVELIWVGVDWLCHLRMGECKNCRRKVGWERVVGEGFYICAGVCGLIHWVCWRWGTRKREVILISLSHWGSGGGGREVLAQQGFINWGGPCENFAWAELWRGKQWKLLCQALTKKPSSSLRCPPISLRCLPHEVYENRACKPFEWLEV